MKKIIASFVLLLISCTMSFAQCAMCRASVESTYSDGHYLNGSGLNTGILYLLVMPYLLVALIAYLWYKGSRKEHAQKMAIWQRMKKISHS